LRCDLEKRPPKDRQINSEISSTVKKYDVNWKLSFTGGCPDIPKATHSIHSPGGHDTMTRVGHRGDSVSSPNACGKLESPGFQHSFMSLRVNASLLIGSRPTIPRIYWTEALSIPVHGKLKSATWASKLTQRSYWHRTFVFAQN
jgi:hypothetical protein